MKVTPQIYHWRRELRRLNLDKRLDILSLARLFETEAEKQARLALTQLRYQDWK